MENTKAEAVDLSTVDFTFTPSWARKEAGVDSGGISGSDGGRRETVGRPLPRGGDRPAPRGKPSGRPPRARTGEPPRERREHVEFETKVLPETSALGTVIRKLQQDFHAYKLKDLAYFFLDNPASVLLRMSPRAGAEGAPRLYQCKACGFAAFGEDAVAAHAIAAHLGDYFKEREVECEPPKGGFSCVAKCGLSGVLLGPPNFHGYQSAVKSVMAARYPGMSEEEYRSRIVMVRDPEIVEEWRKGATKKTVYVAEGESGGEFTREQAEARFRREMLPSLLLSPKVLSIDAASALESPSPAIRAAARAALEAERRAPAGMCFALRGAFHHRKFRFFRANDSRGPEFVASVEYKKFDAAHAIPELAAVAKFIAENPCRPRQAIASDPETARHLDWLASTGHVVAFSNGVYSEVEDHPKYGPQWQKKTLAAAKGENTAGDGKTGDGTEDKKETQDEAPAELAQ